MGRRLRQAGSVVAVAAVCIATLITQETAGAQPVPSMASTTPQSSPRSTTVSCAGSEAVGKVPVFVVDVETKAGSEAGASPEAKRLMTALGTERSLDVKRVPVSEAEIPDGPKVVVAIRKLLDKDEQVLFDRKELPLYVAVPAEALSTVNAAIAPITAVDSYESAGASQAIERYQGKLLESVASAKSGTVESLAAPSGGFTVDLSPPAIPNDPREPTDISVMDAGGAPLDGCKPTRLPFTITGAPAGATVTVAINGVTLAPVPLGGRQSEGASDETTATSTTAKPPSDGQNGGAQTTVTTPPVAASSSSGGSTGGLLLGLLAGLLVGAIGGAFAVRRFARPPSPDAPYTPGPAGTRDFAPAAAGFGAPNTPVRSEAVEAAALPTGRANGVSVAPDAFQRVAPRPAAAGWTGTIAGDRTVRIDELGMHRLMPHDSPSGRSWAYEADGVMAAAGWIEKKTGLGEDAEPTLRVHSDGSAILGVYDGTGGAGSATARWLRDGTELSGAYVAARLVRDLVENWITRRFDDGSMIEDADELTGWVSDALRDEAATIPASTSAVRGSLSKKLPTTAAVVALTPMPGQGVWIDTLWAGDSRAFALTASNGLQVLTIDDTRETDALALIRNDQPMTNLVSADKSFHFNYRTVERSGPVVFLTATDGCFGYVPTPAHFEHLLLDALRRARSMDEWSALVVEELSAFTGDDASFALVTSGFTDFPSLQRAFQPRFDALDSQHWKPYEAASEADRERFREWSWSKYRDGYEALIAGAIERR